MVTKFVIPVDGKNIDVELICVPEDARIEIAEFLNLISEEIKELSDLLKGKDLPVGQVEVSHSYFSREPESKIRGLYTEIDILLKNAIGRSRWISMRGNLQIHSRETRQDFVRELLISLVAFS